MSKTSFENLPIEDQRIVDYHMLRKAVRSEQLIKKDGYDAADVKGTERMDALRQRFVDDLAKGGKTAEHLRTAYYAANPSQIHDQVDSLGR